MADEWTSQEIERVIKECIRRGQTDAEYRKLALEDPTLAVEKVAGRGLPETLKIKFFDGTGAHMSIVLPELETGDGELSDSQLEQVAGGARCAASCAASCAVTSTVSVGLPGVGAVGGCV
jgi:hypothetical protein